MTSGIPMKRIIIDNLSKRFAVSRRENRGVLARILAAIFPGNGKRRIQVADGVSFEAEAGENIGVIGLNGSGKSTLLRLVAGIYQKDSGLVRTEGSMVYLSGFGQGLQSKLTMRENIRITASLMGLSRSEIDERFDEIVEFSGLRDSVDTKVLHFSSGMVTRLNFSVMIFCISHRKPEILLLDEVISGGGGDIDFQSKALAKMEEFIRGGATVLMVSHELAIIEKYCDKVIWLDKGKVVKIGLPADIIREYASGHAS